VQQGIADVAAIDSTVLDAAMHADAQLVDALRIVKSVGPRPMPPWVLSTRIEADVRRKVQLGLTSLHRDAAGATLLAHAQMTHLVAVDHGTYDPVRRDASYKEGSRAV
jgi:ABC-type phosphate/phosphonate transport system substrate-binding protein